MTVSEMIKSRNLPDFLSRDEMIEKLLTNEYGYMPELEYEITVSDPVRVTNRYCNSTVEQSRVDMTVTTKYGSHTFPIHRMLHTDGTVNPFFVFLSFSSMIPNRSYPAEEVADLGVDVLMINYTDIATDNGDFTNGIPSIFIPEGRQNDTDCGKIMYWSWAAQRVMDYAQTLPMLDHSQAAVVGHSRLGKTALLTGVLDERFRYVFSNCSGGSGSALSRGNSGLADFTDWNPEDPFNFEHNYKTGETIRDILRNFPYWFCGNYQKCMKDNYPEDFDQHFLVASVAPRYAYVASGSTDKWADPVSEFLSAVAGSAYYEKLGLTGLVHQEKLPEPDERFQEGMVGYHMRKGPHFFSRHDWNNYIAFIRKHQFD